MKEKYIELKNKFLEKLRKDTVSYYIIILLVALFVCTPLFTNRFIQTDDGTAHFSRNYATIQGLKNGELLSAIVPNFCGGFGYSWNLFYPPLSTYLNAIFYLIFSNYILSMKCLIVFSVIFAGIFMFKFIQNVTKNQNTSLIVSVLYMTSIYFIADIYVRLAIGEIMTYIFLPLLFWGLYSIFYEKGKKNYLLTIGAVGVLLSHNISSLITALLSIILILIHWKKLFKNEDSIQIWKNLLVNAVFIILIVLFFMMPLLEHKLGAEYIAMTKDGMATKEFVVNSTIDLNQLSKALGIIILISLLFTPSCYRKIDKSKRCLYFSTLILGIITAFISTKWFPWNSMPELFLSIQFPWRILLFSTFFLSIIAGINISIFFVNNNLFKLFIVILISIICSQMCINKVVDTNFIFDLSYLYETDEIENIYVFSQQCANYEYLPVKARTPYIQSRKDNVVVLLGDAKISNEKKDGTNMQFDIENNKSESILELPYIYYLGYNIKLNEKEIRYQESDNGFISITIPKENSGTIQLKYTGTMLTKISIAISIIGTIGFIIYIINQRKKEKIY